MKKENKKERIAYPKEFKIKIMIKLSKNEDIYEIFKSSGYNIDSYLETDKKYLSKLIHKWRKELYGKRESIFFSNQELTTKTILKELNQNELKNEENLFEKYYTKKYKKILSQAVKNKGNANNSN